MKYPLALSASDSALSQIREPHLFPELSALREQMGQWRFYHHFPTGSDAPARNPQPAVQTTVLDHSGQDLAAAIQTIFEIGDREALQSAVRRALSNAELEVDVDGQCRMAVQLVVPGIGRKLQARELSDGTLRFLYLVAALLSPRRPAFMALNEPETSLHPDVLDALAQLIVAASNASQMWVVTHSEILAERVEQYRPASLIRLHMIEGETRVVGRTRHWFDNEDGDDGEP